jgi:hypothetical protein
MKTTVGRLLIGVCLVSSVMTVAAQTDARIDRQLEEAMTRGAPEWRSDKVPDDPARPSGYRAWSREGRHVSVSYYILATGNDAAEFLRRQMAALSIPSRPIDGLASEAYIVAPSNPNGERVIHLRVGRIVAIVRAPGEDNTRYFTRLFIPELVKRANSDTGR